MDSERLAACLHDFGDKKRDQAGVCIAGAGMWEPGGQELEHGPAACRASVWILSQGQV